MTEEQKRYLEDDLGAIECIGGPYDGLFIAKQEQFRWWPYGVAKKQGRTVCISHALLSAMREADAR